MFEAGTKVKIISAPGIFKDLIGKTTTVGSNGNNVLGKSGETQMVSHPTIPGAGFFLKPSEMETV